MRNLIFVALCWLVLALPAQAVTFWDDGFESGSTGWTLVAGMAYETSIVHTGSRSMREIFVGNHVQGGTFTDRTHTFTSDLYTRYWIYMPSSFQTDAQSETKSMLLGEGCCYPSYWLGFGFGSKNLRFTAQGIGDSSGNFGNATSVNYVGQITLPQDQWVCVETHIRNSTPGVADGVLQIWVNDSLSLDANNVPSRAATSTPICQGCGVNSPSAGFQLARFYVQYGGPGSLYYDDVAVGNSRIGCAVKSGGASPLPPADTTLPNAPTDLRVTELWERLKTVVAAVWSWLGPASAEAAVPNDKLTLSWTSQESGVDYDLRWQYFAHPDWINLGLVPSKNLQLVVPFSPPISCQVGQDCYVCADARAKRVSDGVTGPWLSETPGGKACNQFAVGPIVLPPDPQPEPDPEIIGPAIVTMSGDKVFIACDPARYTKASTTGRGTKRTITCLP